MEEQVAAEDKRVLRFREKDTEAMAASFRRVLNIHIRQDLRPRHGANCRRSTSSAMWQHGANQFFLVQQEFWRQPKEVAAAAAFLKDVKI